MHWRRFIVAVAAGLIVTIPIFLFRVAGALIVVLEDKLTVWLAPFVPQWLCWYFAWTTALAVSALPGLALATAIAIRRSHGDETRCRRCGYILRGLAEPRCSECGERI